MFIVCIYLIKSKINILVCSLVLIFSQCKFLNKFIGHIKLQQVKNLLKNLYFKDKQLIF